MNKLEQLLTGTDADSERFLSFYNDLSKKVPDLKNYTIRTSLEASDETKLVFLTMKDPGYVTLMAWLRTQDPNGMRDTAAYSQYMLWANTLPALTKSLFTRHLKVMGYRKMSKRANDGNNIKIYRLEKRCDSCGQLIIARKSA